MRRLFCLGVTAILALAISGCGGDGGRRISGPGLVGIDDSDDVNFAPLLTVRYVDPVTSVTVTAQILSDPASDGDIAFDPVLGFNVRMAPLTVLFGVDSFDRNLPEFKAFLTFPLDGVTGQDVVPSGVPIISAEVELYVTEVSFSIIVPTFLDLVPYGVLGAEDFDTAFLDFRSLDFFSSDVGNFVLIDVTPLMQTAQALDLFDFQIRLSLDDGVSGAGTQVVRPQAAQKKAERTVSPSSIAGKRPARAPQAVGSSSGQGADRPNRSR